MNSEFRLLNQRLDFLDTNVAAIIDLECASWFEATVSDRKHNSAKYIRIVVGKWTVYKNGFRISTPQLARSSTSFWRSKITARIAFLI